MRRKIVSKFDDSMSMFVYVLRHTDRMFYTYMLCPNVYQYLWCLIRFYYFPHEKTM